MTTENHQQSLFTLISKTASSILQSVFTVTDDQNISEDDQNITTPPLEHHQKTDRKESIIGFVSELVYGPQPLPTSPVLEIVFNQEELAEFDFKLDDKMLSARSKSPGIAPESPSRYIPPPSLLPPILSKLLPHLPPMLREATATKLRYCSSTHGISLNTLLRHAEGPALLLARTDDMTLIGAFSNDGLPITKGYVNKLLIVAR
jgi:hypothetical protein